MLGSNLSILGKSNRGKNQRRASRISNRQVSAISLAHHDDGLERTTVENSGVSTKDNLENEHWLWW